LPSVPNVPASPTRARLSLVLLLYFLGVIGVITLAPFRFSIPRDVQVMTTGDSFDIVANILLFLPLGFLYPLTRPGDDEPSVARVLILGLLLSAAIETTQLFERERFSSVIDVITNGAGAALGAVALRATMRRIRSNARLVGRLSLEIPLMGLIYLLVPVLLVASLSAVMDPVRTVALIPLGLIGACLMGAVQQNHFGPSGLFGRATMGVVAAGWMVLGAFPVLLRHPLLGASVVGLVGLATWHESGPAPTQDGAERRFETDTLRSLAPHVAAYFIIVVFLPLAAATDVWHFGLGLTGAGNNLDQQQLRLLEPVASLTMLGYIIAEARGRREQSFGSALARVAPECALVGMAMEASRGFQPGTGASAITFVLMVGGAVLGAGIYHSQRDHVRWILAHRAGSREDLVLAATNNAVAVPSSD
jgi:glycopeptide antibiotics resistance protein